MGRLSFGLIFFCIGHYSPRKRVNATNVFLAWLLPFRLFRVIHVVRWRRTKMKVILSASLYRTMRISSRTIHFLVGIKKDWVAVVHVSNGIGSCPPSRQIVRDTSGKHNNRQQFQRRKYGFSTIRYYDDVHYMLDRTSNKNSRLVPM
jgi:hypothetical protein